MKFTPFEQLPGEIQIDLTKAWRIYQKEQRAEEMPTFEQWYEVTMAQLMGNIDQDEQREAENRTKGIYSSMTPAQRKAMQVFRDAVNSIPDRAQMTQKWVDDMKRLQAERLKFLDMVDAGFFNGMSPEDDAAAAKEMRELVASAQRKKEQHDRDLQSAQVGLYRRTLWDFVLIRRLFGWLR